MKNVRFVGLDIGAETIAVAESGGEVRNMGIIPNRCESIALDLTVMRFAGS